jgi:hypothetical protein
MVISQVNKLFFIPVSIGVYNILYTDMLNISIAARMPETEVLNDTDISNPN